MFYSTDDVINRYTTGAFQKVGRRENKFGYKDTAGGL
jgi:hypothetical protein